MFIAKLSKSLTNLLFLTYKLRIVIQNIVDVKFLNIFFILTCLDIKFLLIGKNSLWFINSLWSAKIFNSIIFNDLYVLFKDYIELIYGEGNGNPL